MRGAAAAALPSARARPPAWRQRRERHAGAPATSAALLAGRPLPACAPEAAYLAASATSAASAKGPRKASPPLPPAADYNVSALDGWVQDLRDLRYVPPPPNSDLAVIRLASPVPDPVLIQLPSPDLQLVVGQVAEVRGAAGTGPPGASWGLCGKCVQASVCSRLLLHLRTAASQKLAAMQAKASFRPGI